jgi:hypothetical protein
MDHCCGDLRGDDPEQCLNFIFRYIVCFYFEINRVVWWLRLNRWFAGHQVQVRLVGMVAAVEPMVRGARLLGMVAAAEPMVRGPPKRNAFGCICFEIT